VYTICHANESTRTMVVAASQRRNVSRFTATDVLRRPSSLKVSHPVIDHYVIA
jgi:hypothetical protein